MNNESFKLLTGTIGQSINVGRQINKLDTFTKDYDTYQKQAELIDKIVAEDLYLSTQYGDEIRNLTQQQIKQLMFSIIKGIQQKQLRLNRKKIDETYDEVKAEKQWTSYYQNNQLKKNENWMYVKDGLGLTGNQQELPKKITASLAYLGLVDWVFYNQQTKQLESLYMRNKNGTKGKKINIRTLWMHLDVLNPFLQAVKGKSKQIVQRARNGISSTPQYKIVANVVKGLQAHKTQSAKTNFIMKADLSNKLSSNQIKSKITRKLGQYISNEKYKGIVDGISGQAKYLSTKGKIDVADLQIYKPSTVLEEKQNSTKDLVNLTKNMLYVPESLNTKYIQQIEKVSKQQPSLEQMKLLGQNVSKRLTRNQNVIPNSAMDLERV